MRLQREKELILSILEAYKLDGTSNKVPWGITKAGWEAYARHWSNEVREAVQNHPDCPRHLRDESNKKARA